MTVFLLAAGEATITIMLFLVGKCCYDSSYVVDKKSMLFFFSFSLATDLAKHYSEGFGRLDTLFSVIFYALLLFCILRGGKGRLRRLCCFLEMIVNLMFGMMVLCENVVMQVLPDKNIDERMEYSIGLYAVLVAVIALYVYFSLYRKQIYLNFGIGERVIMILFNLYMLLLYGVSLVQHEESAEIAEEIEGVVSAFYVIVLVSFYFVFLAVLVKHRMTVYYKKGQEYQKTWMEQELRHFTEYKLAEEETRRFRHDVINNLSCIEAFLQEGKLEEAKRYVEVMLGEVKSLSPAVVTGDEMLDCILSSKWDTMKQEGISFTLDGVLDRGLSWEPIDICTVFANAVDNAIEACRKVEGERRICLNLKYTKNFYCIELKNSAGETDIGKVFGESRYTTKKDTELHGYGLQNMKRTLEKYDSDMEIELAEGYFVVRMIVPA